MRIRLYSTQVEVEVEDWVELGNLKYGAWKKGPRRHNKSSVCYYLKPWKQNSWNGHYYQQPS